MAKAVLAALRDTGSTRGRWSRATRGRDGVGRPVWVHLAAEVGSSRPQLLVNATRWGCRVVPPPTASRRSPRWWRRRDRVRRGRVAGADSADAPRTRPGQAGHHRRRGHRPAALEPFVLYTGVRPTDDQGPARRRVLARIAQPREPPCGLARLHVAISGPPGREARGDGLIIDGGNSLSRRRSAELRAIQRLRRAGSR
jgi:hypothetical protein